MTARDATLPDATGSGTVPAPGPSRVAVVGAGYVGLTTAVVLAHLGHEVRCGEIDPAKVEQLSQGVPTIFEEGLEPLLAEGLASGRLRFVQGAAAAVADAQFVFLCVPTPQYHDGSADVRALGAAAREIAPYLTQGAIVVNKSTVPVGSATLIERLLRRRDVPVVSNPEFLREGTAIHDCLHPDRVVVGSDDTEAAAKVGALFAALGAPVIVTDAATSETIKYAANAFLATKLSFVNAVATLCEHLGASIGDVLLGLGYDHRIGFEYLKPGPGWGGSCLPKDTRALLYMSERSGYEFPLLREVIETNDAQLQSIVDKIRLAAGRPLAEVTVGVWGLAFKAGTDDRRRSPAIDIVQRLLAAGAQIRAHDPAISGSVPELPDDVEIVGDAYLACKGADVVALLTDWDEYKGVDLARVKKLMASPKIVDARNLLDPDALRSAGFDYVGLGNP
ncbi:MAG TPA: UDP-glucose/GDP-mannose dehydrogenase family protein [Acidimicrobiales bacterium]|nr:UDP-glucose/GDP-mannose dehydrogenase family protein [Acidimicrobiales bacterium]